MGVSLPPHSDVKQGIHIHPQCGGDGAQFIIGDLASAAFQLGNTGLRDVAAEHLQARDKILLRKSARIPQRGNAFAQQIGVARRPLPLLHSLPPDGLHPQKRRIAKAMRLFGFNFSGYTSLRRVAMSSAALAMKSETVMSTVLSSLPRTETVPFATSLSPTISI